MMVEIEANEESSLFNTKHITQQVSRAIISNNSCVEALRNGDLGEAAKFSRDALQAIRSNFLGRDDLRHQRHQHPTSFGVVACAGFGGRVESSGGKQDKHPEQNGLGVQVDRIRTCTTGTGAYSTGLGFEGIHFRSAMGQDPLITLRAISVVHPPANDDDDMEMLAAVIMYNFALAYHVQAITAEAMQQSASAVCAVLAKARRMYALCADLLYEVADGEEIADTSMHGHVWISDTTNRHGVGSPRESDRTTNVSHLQHHHHHQQQQQQQRQQQGCDYEQTPTTVMPSPAPGSVRPQQLQHSLVEFLLMSVMYSMARIEVQLRNRERSMTCLHELIQYASALPDGACNDKLFFLHNAFLLLHHSSFTVSAAGAA